MHKETIQKMEYYIPVKMSVHSMNMDKFKEYNVGWKKSSCGQLHAVRYNIVIQKLWYNSF